MPLAGKGLVTFYPASAPRLPHGNGGTNAYKNVPKTCLILYLRETQGSFYDSK